MSKVFASGVEGISLSHSANLEKIYFTIRQDRYVWLASQPQTAQYCVDFLEASSAFCHQLYPATPADETELPYILHWTDKRTHPRYIEPKAEQALRAFHRSVKSSHTVKLTDAPQAGSSSGGNVLLFPVLQAGQFNIREEEHAFRLLFDQLARHSARSSYFNEKTKQYFGPLLDLTTGYFGLSPSYSDLVVKSSVAARVIASAPKVNIF